MSKKPDTSWFDLSKYDGLSELDLIGWHRQIEIRAYLLRCFNFEDQHETREEYIRECDFISYLLNRIKTNPIFNNPTKISDDFDILEHRGWLSVFTTSANEHYLMASDKRFNDVWDACKLKNSFKNITDEQEKLINTPMSTLYKSINSTMNGIEHITVNLSASDEQLKKDFDKWLIERRKAEDLQPTIKKIFSDKNMKGWIKHRSLPYIDLTIIDHFFNLRLFKNQKASLIYSDNYTVYLPDRLKRDPKIKKVYELFSETTVNQLWAQIVSMQPKN